MNIRNMKWWSYGLDQKDYEIESTLLQTKGWYILLPGSLTARHTLREG